MYNIVISYENIHKRIIICRSAIFKCNGLSLKTIMRKKKTERFEPHFRDSIDLQKETGLVNIQI